MEVGFYHCTRGAPLAVLPRLAEKAVEAGYRLIVNTGSAAASEEVDEALWTYDAASFLPHGLSGGEHDAEQPILISGSFDAANGARLAVALAGAIPAADAGFERVLYLFDGNEGEAVERARRHWRALANREDVGAVYWQQCERGWEKRG